MSVDPPVPPPGDPGLPTEPLRAPVVPRRPVAPVERLPPLVERERVPRALPPEDPWWSSPWAAVLAGLVGLLAGGVLGYAVRGGGEGAATPARGAALTQTVTDTRTLTQPVVHTDTVTASTVTQAPPDPANEQRRVEAEANEHRLEKEDEELRGQPEGG